MLFYLKRSIYIINAFVFCFLLTTNCSFAQKKDSIPKPTHSPKKAAIMSACLPGLGQAYNHKYWKIPIVYAGLGTFGYLTLLMNSQYKDYKAAYILRTDGDSNTIDDKPEYTDGQLKENVDFYRRYRDMNAVITAAFYALNIIDAVVDAHLFTFDVSDNISFQIIPSINYFSFHSKASSQFGLTIKF